MPIPLLIIILYFIIGVVLSPIIFYITYKKSNIYISEVTLKMVLENPEILLMIIAWPLYIIGHTILHIYI